MVFLSQPSVEAQAQIRFTNVTEESGIDFLHTDGAGGKRYIVEYISSGMAILDFDGDGWLDVYFLNGGALKGSKFESPPRNQLFRNLGNWRFKNVTQLAGVGDTGHGLGVAAADVDNDGDQDIFINNFGSNVLYLNQGDGTFLQHDDDVLAGNTVGAGVSFLDIEGDGDLDLFAANYVDFRYENHVNHQYRGLSTYAGPKDYSNVPDTLLLNQGNGQFRDVSESSGIAAFAGSSMGCLATDFDHDNDTDIIVCNDVMANFLYENDGSGIFEEVGIFAGVAYDFRGIRQGSMGIDIGDLDGDGELDLLMTNYQDETPVIYRNSGIGFYEDVTVETGEIVDATPDVTWGVGLADFDNDFDTDALIASGHLIKRVADADDTKTYEARNLLFANRGDGKFRNVTKSAGSGLSDVKVSRGLALADLDNDGDVDGIILNSSDRSTIMRNDTDSENHWVQIRLHGRSANRDGVGAVVKITTSVGTAIQEVHSGRGYQSHHGMRLHLGLGSATSIDKAEVHWIGGATEVYKDLAIDQLHHLQQGGGKAVVIEENSE